MVNRRWFRKTFINISLAGISILVGLLLVELYFRVFSPLPETYIRPNPYISDQHLGYRFISDAEFIQNKNYFYTDSHGFRIAKGESEPEPNDEVIIVIGDSQTFGWLTKTEDTFAVKIEEVLHEKGKDIHTINASAPGWNLWNYKQVLDQTQREYRNIVAIVLYIVDNDWEPGDKYRIEDGYLEDNYKTDAAKFIPKIVRVKLNGLQIWRHATRVWQSIRHRGNSEQLIVSPNLARWNYAADQLNGILQNIEINQIPLVVILDDEVTEIDVIMELSSSPPVVGQIVIGSIGGGYLYDGHIDVEKHSALADEIVEILLDILP